MSLLVDDCRKAKREYEKCQAEYSLCLNYAVLAKKNRDDAEKKLNEAQYLLAQEQNLTTVQQVENFISNFVEDPLNLSRVIDRYVDGIRSSSVDLEEK